MSIAVIVASFSTGCEKSDGQSKNENQVQDLTGAWRAQIQFTNGAFASINDLEFMYVFNDGGTMTESSNYDAAPPVPPAYGIWREIGKNQFEVRYEFYVSRPLDSLQALTINGGWLPAGRGVLTDTITLAFDGQSFTSKVIYESFDQAGRPIPSGGEANGLGTRMGFGK